MDKATESHFMRWLETKVYWDERDDVERNIRALLQEYPDLIETHTWGEMRDLAESFCNS